MNARLAMMNLLLNEPSINALVGDRVFHRALPGAEENDVVGYDYEAKPDAIVFWKDDGEAEYQGAVATDYWEFESYGAEPDRAVALAEVLNAFFWTVKGRVQDGVYVYSIVPENTGSDVPSPEVEGLFYVSSSAKSMMRAAA